MTVAGSWFTIGSAHVAEGSPCQDYALAEGAYAVVADGCSSSPLTDVGARILAHTAYSVYSRPDIEQDWLSVHQAWRISGEALTIARGLRIEEEALDVSLGVVKHSPSGIMSAVLFGDGVIAYRYRGDLYAVVMDWAGNMPGYMSYDHTGIRRNQFLSQSENFAEAENRTACEVKTWRLSPGGPTLRDTQYLDAPEGLRGYPIQFSASVDLAAACSDGVTQISGVPWHDAVVTLMDFRGPLIGEFVKRRMRAALKTWALDGHAPVDDIAMAAVYRGG